MSGSPRETSQGSPGKHASPPNPSATTSPNASTHPEAATSPAQRSVSLSHLLKSLAPTSSTSPSLTTTTSHEGPLHPLARAGGGLQRLGPSPLLNRPPPSSSPAVGSLTGLLQSAIGLPSSPGDEHPPTIFGRRKESLGESVKSPLKNSFPASALEGLNSGESGDAGSQSRNGSPRQEPVPPEQLVALLDEQPVVGSPQATPGRSPERETDEESDGCKGKGRESNRDGGQTPPNADARDILLALPSSLALFGANDVVSIWASAAPHVFALTHSHGRRDRGRRNTRSTVESEIKDAMRSRRSTADPRVGSASRARIRSRSRSRAQSRIDVDPDDDFAVGAAVLAACIKAHVEAEDGECAGGTGAATVVFWDAIKRIAGGEEALAEGEAEGGDSSRRRVADDEAMGRISIMADLLSVLSRGGRAVYPLFGAADLLSEWVMTLFSHHELLRRRRLARLPGRDAHRLEGALTDPHRETPFVRLGAEAKDDNPALDLLILMHKFSCPQLSASEVSRCTAAVVAIALETTSEKDVASCLTFIDIVVTFGYVPQEHLREVVCLVARVVGMEGKYVILGEEEGGEERAVMDAGLVNQAKATMRNLIRSPANQAIRSLRSILSHCATASPSGVRAGEASASTSRARRKSSGADAPELDLVDVDLPLVVGAIRCLRYALADNDEEVALASLAAAASGASASADTLRAGATALLTLDLPILAPQLEVAMSCDVAEIDAEVLALVDARLAAGQAKQAAASSASAVDQTNGAGRKLEEDLDDHLGSDMWDLWDVTVDLMRLAVGRLHDWESRSHSTSSEKRSKTAWFLTADDPQLATAPQPFDDVLQPNDAALVAFARIFNRLVAVHEEEKAPGPTEKLTALYLETCGLFDDALGVRLLEHCVRDHICVPEEELWLVNLEKLVDSFVFHRESGPLDTLAGKGNLSASVNRSQLARPPCPRTRTQVMLLVRDTYQSVRDLNEWRNPLVEQIIIPLLQRVLFNESDPAVTDYGIEILRNVAYDELLDSLVAAESGSTRQEPEADLFDRLHRLLFSVASSLRKPESRSNPNTSPSKAEHTWSHQEHAAHQAVLALTGMFMDALTTASRYSVCKCVAIFRNLLAILSPTINPAQSLHTLSHDLKPLSDPLPARTRLALLQWMLRLRADQEHRVQFVRDVDVSGLASLLHRTSSTETKGQAVSATPSPLPADVPDSPAGDRRGRTPQSPGAVAPDATTSPDRGLSSLRGRAPSIARSFGTRERSSSKQRKAAYSSGGLWSLPETLPDATWPVDVSPESSQSLVAFDHEKMHEWQEAVDSAAIDMPPVTAQGAGMVVLPISEYLAAIIRILRYEENWDLVSYVLCYLPDQLSNKHFACGPRAAQQIHQLRRLLCGGIIRDTLIDQVTLPSAIKRTDAHAVAYQLLATLIAYRSLFDKAQQDEMVAAFARGLRTAGNTAKACIHAIAMACHELEPSVRKFLPEILTSLARILSTASVSVHILELIATMAQIPPLYANLTESDFQTIFGIAIQYISSHNQQRLDEAERGQAQPSAEIDEAAAIMSAFQQYVYLMAYYIIAVWFVSLKLLERRKYVNFIVAKLVSACHGHSAVDEAAEVCLDMIARYTYANAEPRPRPSLYADTIASALGNPVVEKSWILGNAVISVKSLSRPGWAEVCVRRPSGIVKMMWELENLGGSLAASEMDVLNMVLRHRDTVLEPPAQSSGAAAAPNSASLNSPVGRRRATTFSGSRASAPIGMALERLTLEAVLARSAQAAASDLSASFTELVVDPSFFQLQMSPYPDFPTYKSPMKVPDEPTYKRLISSIDYVPVVDFHKISVLYVGPGQTAEREVLGNVHGSKTYVRFLTALGQLIRLKGCKTHYTGGLDTENDLNGKWTYVWDDDITQIVFHVATLMPTHAQTDPDSIAKKALIGNDFVSIVFNDSGREYRFDTVRSQFNFLNVIIEPHTPAGMAWSAPGMTNNIEFFKVSLQRRAGLPEIGPVGNFKMVSTASLPHFVRQLSLHANIFSQVYLATVGVKTADDRPRHRIEYVSHWRERLRQIRKIRNRIQPGDTVDSTATSQGAGAAADAIDVDALSFARDFTSWTL